MKKILIVSSLGILVGSLFAFYMFSNITKDTEIAMRESTNVTAFQVGVYSVYDNAKKVADTYNNSYIYNDDGKYRVFLAIYQDKEIIEYMKNYYSEKEIEIYLKEMSVDKDFLKQLNKYETLLKESDNNETYIMANKNILGEFAKSL